MYAKILTGPTLSGAVEPGDCICPGCYPKFGTPVIIGECAIGNMPDPG